MNEAQVRLLEVIAGLLALTTKIDKRPDKMRARSQLLQARADVYDAINDLIAKHFTQ